jgi:hypothetical protein
MKKIILTILIFIFAAMSMLGCKNEQNPSAGGAVQTPITPKMIADEMSAYAVEVECGNEAGSGFIIATDEQSVTIATCYHVVDGASGKIVRFYGETDFVSSSLVTFYAYDAFFDVAFLRVAVDNSTGKYKAINKFDAPIVTGEKSFTLANNDGRGLAFTDGVVSVAEEVTSFDKGLRLTTRLTNRISGGASGALVCGETIQPIAMVQGTNDEKGESYALPISIVKALYDRSLSVGVTKEIARYAFDYSKVVKTENNIKTEYSTVSITAEEKEFTFALKNGSLYLETAVEEVSLSAGVKLDAVNGKQVSALSDFTTAVISSANGIEFTSGTVKYGA